MTAVPQCIDPQTGELKLDKDGFPVGMNFWAGMDGQVYVRGHVIATGGKFTGDVTANNFYFNDGGNIRTLLSASQKKISSDWLDLLGINIKDAAGNTMMTIDGTNGITINKGSISWGAVTGTQEIDNRISAAQSAASNAQNAADRAYDDFLKLVGGTYTKPAGTFINGNKISAPVIDGGMIRGTNIYGGKFGDLTDDNNPNVWIQMGQIPGVGYGMHVWAKSYGGYRVFSVLDDATGGAYVQLRSHGILTLESDDICRPQGGWDFSHATVTGLPVQYAVCG